MIVAHASWLVSPRPNGRVLLGKTRKCPGHYVEAQNRIAWHATDSLLNPYVSEWTVNYPNPYTPTSSGRTRGIRQAAADPVAHWYAKR